MIDIILGNHAGPIMEKLILYSKPGCHLCEGLEEKLTQVTDPAFELEIRDITTCKDWFQAYQYSIPVLTRQGIATSGTPIEVPLPRISPGAAVPQVAKLLKKYLSQFPPSASRS